MVSTSAFAPRILLRLHVPQLHYILEFVFITACTPGTFCLQAPFLPLSANHERAGRAYKRRPRPYFATCASTSRKGCLP
ncbi:hypothetical protein Y032_0263g598 [Ancylostoma ceylanicum]|uniref:Uncharacterized protein n=1 Tax=Ancylostoma ceylanicum TaxID=53326 RepID=A0A016S9U8_9BILA|nr:hypothetical protein Y032_0263g598 [Ancylostoma ceylanicum]